MDAMGLSAHGIDGTIVFRLVSSLHIFTDKNEALIDLVCQIRRLKNEPDTKVFLNQQLANVDKSIGIQNSRSGISW
jgi:hypothetical protein